MSTNDAVVSARGISKTFGKGGVTALQDIKSSLDRLGVQIAGSTPEELQRWLGSENARWSQTIRRANIKAEQQ